MRDQKWVLTNKTGIWYFRKPKQKRKKKKGKKPTQLRMRFQRGEERQGSAVPSKPRGEGRRHECHTPQGKEQDEGTMMSIAQEWFWWRDRSQRIMD